MDFFKNDLQVKSYIFLIFTNFFSRSLIKAYIKSSNEYRKVFDVFFGYFQPQNCLKNFPIFQVLLQI